MREFLGFALSKMHKTVIEEEQRYAVVWVQESDHRVGPWMAWRFSESLPETWPNQESTCSTKQDTDDRFEAPRNGLLREWRGGEGWREEACEVGRPSPAGKSPREHFG